MGATDKRWEFLLRRYDLERGDDRNERSVFAALIGALIGVLALSALFLRGGGGNLPTWAYAGVPAAPLAILALIAYVSQVAIVRMDYVRELERRLGRAAETRAPRSPVRGHVWSFWSRVMWVISFGLGLLVVSVVSVLALDRVGSTWLKIVASGIYGSILLIEVAALLRIHFRRASLLRNAGRRAL